MSTSKWERPFVFAAFVIYLVFQLHAVGFHGYWGQDWIAHKNWIAAAAEHPWDFFSHYTQGRTNPPVYDLLGAAVRTFVGLRYYLPAIAVMNVAFGLAGMCAAYAVMRRLIASPVLRMAGIVFLLFLPFAMIHAQVIASDALSTSLFWVLLWLVVKFRPDAPPARFAMFVGGMAVLLIVSILARFTFGSVILATGIWAIALWWTRQLSRRRLVVMLIAVTGVPGLFTYIESVRYRSQQTDSLGIGTSAPLSEAEMNPRSILWFRSADVDVLKGPAYNWLVNRDYDLLVSNKHSFPALLHLAMFTDILNIYQFDPYDSYFGSRTLRNHHRMRTAVRSGIVFSLLATAGVIVFLFRSTVAVVFRRNPDLMGIFTVLLFCLGWFATIVVLYPFIPTAYSSGWWLPRLLAPALIGFFIVGFVLLDRSKWHSPNVHALVMAAVLFQSGMHAAFLWPTASYERLYEPDDDVGSLSWSVPIMRVFSWQEGWETDLKKEYWLDRMLGIVMNLPPNLPRRENWSVSFKVRAGPSAPKGGVLRVSSDYLEPRLFEFGDSRDIRVELPLGAGRNDIRVEFLKPEPVERPGDTLMRMAQISDIQVHPLDPSAAH